MHTIIVKFLDLLETYASEQNFQFCFDLKFSNRTPQPSDLVLAPVIHRARVKIYDKPSFYGTCIFFEIQSFIKIR